jgi:hypothetical protein
VQNKQKYNSMNILHTVSDFQTELCGLYYKCFMIVIYDRNDNGQYYKTTIMIVIDNRNWRS